MNSPRFSCGHPPHAAFRALSFVGVIVLLQGLCRFEAAADVRAWAAPASGSWNVASNWSGGIAPSASDDVLITNEGAFSVSFAAGDTFATLTIGGSQGLKSLAWLSGNLVGSTLVATNGQLNLVGMGDKRLAGVITNHGQITWASGAITNWPWCGDARIENEADGLFDLQVDGAFSGWPGPFPCGTLAPAFNNAGTFQKSGGVGTASFATSFVFTNSGTVDVQLGSLNFLGSFFETPASKITLWMEGTTSDSGYSRLLYQQTPNFAGRLLVARRNEFVPSPGDSFAVIGCPNLVGMFDAIDGLDMGSGLRLEPHFTTTGLTLYAAMLPANSLPVLSIYAAPSSAMVMWPIEFTGWSLLSSTNLTGAPWLPVSVAGTNNAIFPASDARRYYRLILTNTP